MEENNDQEHIQNLILIDFKDKSKLSENEIMDVLFFIVYPFIIKKKLKNIQ